MYLMLQTLLALRLRIVDRMRHLEPRSTFLAWLILAYLSMYPYAKDTVAGISRWWLLMEGVEADLEAVSLAAEELLAWNWLIVIHTIPGRRIYGLNQARQLLLQRFIKNPSPNSLHAKE
jgi:hypothetical protein